MRIAIVSPLYESVPPRLYGGTERVVSYLAEELVGLGHQVTLYASGDSRTSARLRAGAPRGLRLDAQCRDPIAPHLAMLHDVLEQRDEFDVIHFHNDYLHYPSVRELRLRALTTIHGRLDLPELVELYRRYPDVPLASISNAQRAPIPWAHWLGTVHHGLPLDLLRPGSGGRHAVFLGRISPEKRPDRAIRIARAAGMRLVIAAKVDRADRAYFEEAVEPLLGDGVEFIGEIGEHEKEAFLGGAAALLFPIDWPEPFGLVMVEAMACGTPVIAWPCGSVPEIVEPGRTGWIVQSEREAAERLAAIASFDRGACRRCFEERFSAGRMARDYLTLYRRLAARDETRDALPSAA